MSTGVFTPAPALETHPPAYALSREVDRCAAALREVFNVEFFIYHGETAKLLHRRRGSPAGNIDLQQALVRPLCGQVQPAFLAEADPVLLFALPIYAADLDVTLVAAAEFVTARLPSGPATAAAADLIGLAPSQAAAWINRQETWSPRQLEAVGAALLQKLAVERKAGQLTDEVESISNSLASTFEEISVLYGVTQNLKLSSTDEQLGRLALDWLHNALPAAGLSIVLSPVGEDDASPDSLADSTQLSVGDVPVDLEQFAALQTVLDAEHKSGPIVLNQSAAPRTGWQFRDVRELVAVPLEQGETRFGWLAAFNHTEGGEFGTVEASLLSSVAAILGVHSGNVNLYRQQAGFLGEMVLALTSAIDAKDPYTCGHSDRVARLAVRLGQHLGCDVADLNKLYMGGLLHDIGKIGIDDRVLRKPGDLTKEEYEHIKLHPELGYNILRDVKRLKHVLPIVLHHHESWDGSGYPHQLAGEEIPYLARICAVADGFDAMSSDRPYRRGLPDDRVDAIFRAGRGKQWDAQVIDAFFAVRDDIRAIAQKERANLALDVQLWD